MLILKLNKVERPDYRASGSGYRDHDDEGDLAQGQRENTRLVYVPWDKVRNFQPRRENKPGSRLTFVDGGGYAVTETCDQIIGLLGPDADVRGVSAEVLQLPQSQAN